MNDNFKGFKIKSYGLTLIDDYIYNLEMENCELRLEIKRLNKKYSDLLDDDIKLAKEMMGKSAESMINFAQSRKKETDD